MERHESLVQGLLHAGYSEEDLEREISDVIGRYLSTEAGMPPSWVESELNRMHPLSVRLSRADWEFIAFCTTDSIRNATVELFGCPLEDIAGKIGPLTAEELNLREQALHQHARELMLYVAQQKRAATAEEFSGSATDIEEWYAAV